jgi:hypothetical protein
MRFGFFIVMKMSIVVFWVMTPCSIVGGYQRSSKMLTTSYNVGFEVLTAVSTKMAVFWVVAPCSLVEVSQRFRGPCCLHHQGDE